jgi:hypothetical protein
MFTNPPQRRRWVAGNAIWYNLKKVVNDLQPEELFWIIKNGIKMTGMPSFGAEKPPLTDK